MLNSKNILSHLPHIINDVVDMHKTATLLITLNTKKLKYKWVKWVF